MLERSFGNILLALAVLIFIQTPCIPSNTLGGDITWKNTTAGNFTFQLRLHVQCGGSAPAAVQALSFFNHPTLNSIQVNLISQSDISPVCTGTGTNINCTTGGQGAVNEYIYQSGNISISGVPPPGGWIITYSECCRLANTNLTIGTNTGLTLYSKIFPFLNKNISTYIDNSVDFLSSPQTIVCNTNPQTLLFYPSDNDLDSISVRFSDPLNNFTGTFTPPINPSQIPYNPGFSALNPFPAASALSLDARTGQINFTPSQAGDFSYSMIFESWRCGIKLSEIHKEFQVGITPCSTNAPPVITPPFSGGYETTLVAGTNINFSLTASDIPSQNISWEVYGNQFGNGLNNPSAGCQNTPCSTVNPVPPSPTAGNNTISFNWQTNCSHLGSSLICSDEKKTYQFYFSAKDDACPVPSINSQTVLIHLTPPAILPSPEIKCISSLNNNIQINWTIPPDPNNTFAFYTIYFSVAANGPFDTLATISSYTQTQYSLPSSTVNLNGYYFIKSFGCGGFVSSPAIDTVRPITLNVNNPSNGTAQLFWNAFTSPLPTSSCGWYRIFKEYPTGIWSLLDSTQNLSYVDTITVCQSQINYQIEICDNSGCLSKSTIDGDLFLDQTDPVTPILDSVSIDGNGKATLGWQASSSDDVFAYVIYQKNGLVYVPVDTIFGNSVFNYTYVPSNASAGSETYVIAAFDSCGNISNLGLPHNTIFLSKQYNLCNFTASLNWNPYINMADGGIGFYEIQCSTNGSPWTLIGTTTTNVFTHDSLVVGSTYCYRIVARSSGGNITSVSNQQCVSAVGVNSPSFLYISRVSVNSDHVIIEGITDNSTGVSLSGFELYKAGKSDINFTPLDFIPYNGTNSFTYSDFSAQPEKESYRYYVRAIDSCNNPGIRSDTSETIFCTAFRMEDFKIKINWSNYSKWLGGVLAYNVYRSINANQNAALITTIPSTGALNYSYTDDIGFLVSEEGKFEYFIEGVEGPGNPYGIVATTFSNRAVVYKDADIFVPNAFVPRGVNKIFKPITQFVDQQDYKFSIFDRWGHKLWETNDYNEGWDGSDMVGGVYLWMIEFKNARGEYFEKKGHVVLIR